MPHGSCHVQLSLDLRPSRPVRLSVSTDISGHFQLSECPFSPKLHALETLPSMQHAENPFHLQSFLIYFHPPSSLCDLVGGKLLLFLGLGSVARILYLFHMHRFLLNSNLPMLKSGQFINHVGRISSSLKSCQPKHMTRAS